MKPLNSESYVGKITSVSIMVTIESGLEGHGLSSLINIEPGDR